MTEDKYIILDSSVLVSGFNIGNIDAVFLTTEEIIEEIKTKIRHTINSYIATNKIQIYEPSQKAISKIYDLAKKTGDIIKLSENDIKLLALLLDKIIENKQVYMATNDYAIQNIAYLLGAKVITIGYRGIEEIIFWDAFCPKCKRTFSLQSNIKKCPYCDVNLKRFKRRKNVPKVLDNE